MRNGIKYFKYSTYIIVVLFAYMFFKSCRCNREKEVIKNVPGVTVKRDTVWKEGKDSIVYIPKPYKITLHDTLEIETDSETRVHIDWDNEQKAKDWERKIFYSDTQQVKYGSVIINDTVTHNRITGRGLITDLKIPEITKTVTITETQKRRNVLLGGFGVGGNKQTPILATNVSLGLLTKKDKYYGIEAMLLKDGSPVYKIQTLFPLFKKQ